MMDDRYGQTGPKLRLESDGPASNAHEWIEVRDKFTGDVFAQVARGTQAHFDLAIADAFASRSACRASPPHARAATLTNIADAVARSAEHFAQVMVRETGKTIRDCRAEVGRCVDTFRLSAHEAVGSATVGHWVDMGISPRTTGYQAVIRRFPVGVCSFITPFNFPLNLVAHKIGPAIAAGCPWVLKPADKAPVSALLLAEILQSAGLPDGSWSVIPALVEDSNALIEDDRIALLSFTGSARVGYALKARSGRKRVTLELGGNAACIVEPDADLEHVAQRLTLGAFGANGQSCISVQRVYAHERVIQPLAELLTARARALVIGDPRDESTDIGPLITQADAERIEEWVSETKDRHARVLCGGARRGAFFEPTWLTGVPADVRISCQEVFGPVALIDSYASFEDALARVNSSEFGLQAGVFTRDLAKARRAFETLEVGGVVINDSPTMRSDALPYGGVKQSGLGREGVRSAIEELTEVRVMLVSGNP